VGTRPLPPRKSRRRNPSSATYATEASTMHDTWGCSAWDRAPLPLRKSRRRNPSSATHAAEASTTHDTCGCSAWEHTHFRRGSRDDGIPPAPLPHRKRLRSVTPGDVPRGNSPASAAEVARRVHVDRDIGENSSDPIRPVPRPPSPVPSTSCILAPIGTVSVVRTLTGARGHGALNARTLWAGSRRGVRARAAPEKDFREETSPTVARGPGNERGFQGTSAPSRE
jgi:hypothetical protein